MSQQENLQDQHQDKRQRTTLHLSVDTSAPPVASAAHPLASDVAFTALPTHGSPRGMSQAETWAKTLQRVTKAVVSLSIVSVRSFDGNK